MSLNDRQLATVSKVYSGLNNLLGDAIKAQSTGGMDSNMMKIQGDLMELMNEFSVLEPDDWKEVERRFKEAKENNTIENFRTKVEDTLISYEFKFDETNQLNKSQEALLKANIFKLASNINTL